MKKLSYYLNILQIKIPDLKIKKVKSILSGQNNDVFILNDALIFRFPRYKDGITSLTKECKLLLNWYPLLPLTVPFPIYYNLNSKIPEDIFMGYKKIRGEPLQSSFVMSNQSRKQKLANQLANFLQTLHSLPCEIDSGDKFQSGFLKLYDEIQQYLFPLMSQAARTKTELHFKSFFSLPKTKTSFPTVWIHGDFGVGNILYDREEIAITGVIDFGSAQLGDPAYDIAGLFNTLGKSFVQEMATSYPEINDWLLRIQFYAGTFALQEALFGLKFGDNKALQNGLYGFENSIFRGKL